MAPAAYGSFSPAPVAQDAFEGHDSMYKLTANIRKSFMTVKAGLHSCKYGTTRLTTDQTGNHGACRVKVHRKHYMTHCLLHYFCERLWRTTVQLNKLTSYYNTGYCHRCAHYRACSTEKRSGVHLWDQKLTHNHSEQPQSKPGGRI